MKYLVILILLFSFVFLLKSDQEKVLNSFMNADILEIVLVNEEFPKFQSNIQNAIGTTFSTDIRKKPDADIDKEEIYEKILKSVLPNSSDLALHRKALASHGTFEYIKSKIANVDVVFDFQEEKDRFRALDILKKALSWHENPLLDSYKDLCLSLIAEDLSVVSDDMQKKSLIGDRIEVLAALKSNFSENFLEYDMPNIVRSEYIRMQKIHGDF